MTSTDSGRGRIEGRRDSIGHETRQFHSTKPGPVPLVGIFDSLLNFQYPSSATYSGLTRRISPQCLCLICNFRLGKQKKKRILHVLVTASCWIWHVSTESPTTSVTSQGGHFQTTSIIILSLHTQRLQTL